MDPLIGDRIYAPAPQPFLGTNQQDRLVSASEATSREIDLAVKDLIERAATLAQTTLEARRNDLEAGALLLLERETVTAADFEPLRRAASEAAQLEDARMTAPPEAGAQLSAA